MSLPPPVYLAGFFLPPVGDFAAWPVCGHQRPPDSSFRHPGVKSSSFEDSVPRAVQMGTLPGRACRLSPIPESSQRPYIRVRILHKTCHIITSVTWDEPRACGQEGCSSLPPWGHLICPRCLQCSRAPRPRGLPLSWGSSER